MPLNRIGLLTFIASFFGLLLTWGYFPKLGVTSWAYPTLWGLAVVGLILALVFSLEQIRAFLKLRSTQFGIGLAITATMVIAILGAVNWMAFTYNQKWDLTKNKLYSLSEQTENILNGLKEIVTIRVWTTNVEAMGGTADLPRFLENYKIKGKGKIQVEIKNPNDFVVEAEADQIKKGNIIIVRATSGREHRIETFNDTKGEELITNAIVQTQKAGKKLVCFIEGHGELSINDNQAGGLSFAKERLQASSYDTKEISLASAEFFPNDCEVTVIPGPQSAGTEREFTMLKEYLAKGGKLLALYGPGTHPSWNVFTQQFGVEVVKDVILDMRQRPATLVVTNKFSSDVEITKSFNSNLVLLESSSIKTPTQLSFEGAEIKPFVSSQDWTYAKEGLISGIKNSQLLSADKRGPLSLAVLITKPVQDLKSSDPIPQTPKAAPTPKSKETPSNQGSLFDRVKSLIGHKAYAAGNDSKAISPHEMPPIGSDNESSMEKKPKNEMSIIVVGSHKFAANAFIGLHGNLDFLMNSISYLSKDQDLIGIRPRENSKANLQLTNESPKQVIATVLLMALIFGIGFFWSLSRKFTTNG
jgi:ABC-type uncharacterized transport system involved in gliding motility auxiliary subunit